MKQLPIFRFCLGLFLLCCSMAFTNDQDAKKDVALIAFGTVGCKAGLVQMAVKNISATKKIDVLIIKKETGGGLTTTSTAKYSGLPPGYKQPLGCGGHADKDSLLVIYTISAAVYSH
jgi:hypothetical protein